MKRIMAVMLMAAMLLCGCNKLEKQPAAVDESIVKGKPAYGGELSLYSFQQDTFNPLLTHIKANYDVLTLMFEPVVKNTPDGKTKGVLATSWEKSDDGKTYTIEVRDDVLFHNGDKLTAKDVASSIAVAASDKSPFYSSLNVIDKVKTDDNKVVITLVKPVADFISLLEIPVVKSESADKKDNFSPVGTGAYVYSGSKKNKTYTLSANDSWWQGKAYISKINVKILPDKASVTYGYDSANVDAFSTDVITAGKYAGDGQSRVSYYTEDNLVLLGFNNLSIPFATADARKDIAKCIDKSKLNEEVVFSKYSITETPINPTKDIYNQDAPRYSPYQSYFSGVEIVPFEVLVCSSNPTNSRIGEAVVQQLKAAGYNASLVSLPEDEYTSRIAARQYDAFVGTFAMTANNDLTNLLGEGNYFNYTSEAMEGYLSSLALAKSDEQAKNTYLDIQNLYSADLPFISLFYEKKALVVRNNVGGDLSPTQCFVYNGIGNWYTKTK